MTSQYADHHGNGGWDDDRDYTVYPDERATSPTEPQPARHTSISTRLARIVESDLSPRVPYLLAVSGLVCTFVGIGLRLGLAVGLILVAVGALIQLWRGRRVGRVWWLTPVLWALISTLIAVFLF